MEVEDNIEDDEDGAKEDVEDGAKAKECVDDQEEEEDVVKKYGLDTYDEDGALTSLSLDYLYALTVQCSYVIKLLYL